MTRPTFPLICLDDNQIDLATKGMTKAVASALVGKSVFANAVHFDKNGDKWTFTLASDKFKSTFISRFLAKNLLYNPLVEVNQTWQNLGKYSLEELKNQINKIIDKDDDIITQFEEGNIIKVDINNCASFDDLVKALKKYINSADT